MILELSHWTQQAVGWGSATLRKHACNFLTHSEGICKSYTRFWIGTRVVFFTLLDKFTKINNAHCGCTISRAGADVSKGQLGVGRGKELELRLEGGLLGPQHKSIGLENCQRKRGWSWEKATAATRLGRSGLGKNIEAYNLINYG